MNKLLLLIFIGSLSSFVFAGDCVVGSTIIEIRNTGSNQDKFEVVTSGGTGPCVGKTIMFPADAAPNRDIFTRAYSAALTAFSTGAKVRIYNYHDDSCLKASYITLKK